MKLFDRIFRRRPLRIHLGKISIAPRTEVFKYFEVGFDAADDSDLQAYVLEWLELPSAPAVGAGQDTDLALDVVVTRYRLGEATSLSGHTIPFIGWRPMIELAARAYFVQTGKEFATIGIRHKMPWGPFFKRVLAFRLLSPLASKKDMRLLMGQALEKLLRQILNRPGF